MTHPYTREFAQPVDGTNKLQLEERADKSPAELVAEFREKGQIAVRNRQNLPWLLRKIPIPMGPEVGLRSFEYLMDIIYPRDQWMHHYDICAATGRTMVVTPEHDGRVVALVVRDIAAKLRRQLTGRTIALRLTGPAGGDYLFGSGSAPDCFLEIDFFAFNLRASGRISTAAALSQATISGDEALASWLLESCEVLY